MTAKNILSDAIWCTIFPTIPCTIRYVGQFDRTYFGYTSGDGGIGVGFIDHNTGAKSEFVVASGTGINDHNSATVFPLADGRLLVAWTYHGSTGDGLGGDLSVRYRITSSPEDLATLGSVQTISYATRTHYSQIFQHGNRVGIWSRVGGFSSETWRLAISENLTTWTRKTVWSFASNRLYQLLRERADGGYWLGLQTHPEQGGDQSIRMARFDPDSGSVIHAGTDAVMGNAYTGDGLPLAWTSAQLVYAPVTGDHTRLHDVNKWGDCLIGCWGDTYQNGEYLLARRSLDGTYAIESLSPIGKMVSQNNGYVGDATFDFSHRDRIWLSREEGNVWRIYQYDKDSTGWRVSLVSSRESPALRFRPRAVENAHPSLAVAWNEVNKYTTLDDWNGAEIWGASAARSLKTIRLGGVDRNILGVRIMGSPVNWLRLTR